MKIETRFNIGDTVFYMMDNRVRSGVVSGIFTVTTAYDRESGKVEKDILYSLYAGNVVLNTIKYGQHRLFGSKEELLASL